METIGVAVVGSSGHAARVAAPAIDASPRARVAGVLGSTVERGSTLAAQYDGCTAYASLDELTADPAIGAVWVAGPNDQHVEVAAACLRAGKHVLVEKPMATRHEDAARLAALVEETGLALTVAFQHRFRPAHRWMRDAIRDGAVGRVCLVRVHRFWPFPYFPGMPADLSSTWRTSLETSGGWAMNDIGSHLIDLATWLAGEPATLTFSRTANYKFPEASAEDTALLVLETPSGALLTIETSNAMASFPGTVEVHGLDGWLRGEATFDEPAVVATSAGETRTFPAVTHHDVYVASFEDFLDAVDGRETSGATASDGAANVAIVEAAAAAHAARQAGG